MTAQYEYPAHTLPPPPPQGPGTYGPRSRAQSNASMNKYVPDVYRTPEPGSHQEAGGGYFPIPPRARGPSVGGQPISSTPPLPNSYPGHSSGFYQQQGAQPPPSSFGGMPGPYTPGANSAYATPGPNTPAAGPLQPPYPQAVNELRPPEEPPRRRSDASTRSHHSHHSRHSSRRRSESRKADTRRRHSHEDGYDYEYEREKRHREKAERRASAPDPHGKDKLSRTRTRPTLGDTVYSSFRNIKYWLGPRDKY